ncbi:MAG: T9SS type A sorting domain-containing protein, partial [Prolixibacteraceae bacterium]|nr:T9SS type A sorting domain-containing protein [Prolixibacteraceae bacterium]
GRNTTYESYAFSDELNRRIPDTRDSYEYDASGYIMVYHNYEWDTLVTAGWVEKYKMVYTYNAGHQVTQMIIYFWDDDAAALVTGSKILYTYNTVGQVTLETNYGWDTDLNDWSLFSKTENVYSGGNMVKSEYSINMGEDMWMLFYRYEYTYNGNGDVTQEIISSLNYMTFSLTYSGKDVYTYNASGDNTLVQSYDWDAGTGSWINSSKEEYTFNGSHYQLTYKYYTWSNDPQSWVASEMEEYTYDVHGNLTSMVFYDGINGNEWIQNSKTEVTYNTSYSGSQILYPYIYSYFDALENIGNMVTVVTDSRWENNQWVFDTKANYYYSSVNVTEAPLNREQILSVYPNPTNNFINIETGGNDLHVVSLYNLTGEQIMKKQFSSKIRLQVENLSHGIYLLKIESENAPAQVEKVVIR